VHRVDAGIDTGPILLERRLDLSGARSVQAARDIAFEQVARLVAPAVVGHARNEIEERAAARGEAVVRDAPLPAGATRPAPCAAAAYGMSFSTPPASG
jgi:hypothetical protein